MSAHVVIIGAGVIGLSTACSLARAGLRVTVLERGSPGRESSWAGAGILSALLPWDYPDAVHRLVEEGRKLWPAWAVEIQRLTGIDPEYRVSGMLALDVADSERARDWCLAQGWSCQAGRDNPAWVRSAAATDGAGFDGPASAHLWLPEVAQVRNPRLVRGMARLAGDLGVTILEDQTRIDLRSQGNRITQVLADRGEIACTHLVVCAGAWTSGVLAGLGIHVPIRPVRGQMLLFRDAPGRLPCIVHRQGHYLVPRSDGHILAGSTLEDVGYDKTVTQEALVALRQFAWETLPWLKGVEPLMHWSGLRPGSSGNIPIIARHPAIANLYVNSGHHRYGVTMAPASAQRLTRLLLEPDTDSGTTDYAWRSQ